MTWRFRSCPGATMRATARRCLSVRPGQPEEWETLTRLAAIARGQGGHQDAGALDDAQFADEAQRLYGAQAEAVLQATQGLRGPQRMLDAALRGGPYGEGFGDGFGTRPERPDAGQGDGRQPQRRH